MLDLKDKYDIVIIGGGVAGLSCAHDLKNTGLDVLLLERKPKYVDMNRGDTLYPHSLDILKRWDMLQKILDRGAIKSEKIFIYQDDKESIELEIIDKNRQGEKNFLSLDHVLIEQTLFDGLVDNPHITLALGANVTEIVESAQCIDRVIVKVSGEEKIISGKLFICADGRDSNTRNIINVSYDTHDFDHDILILTSTVPDQYNFQSWFVYGKHHEMLIGPLPENRMRISLILKDGETMEWMKMNDEEITKKIREESQLLSSCNVTKNESHIYEIKSSTANAFNYKNMILVGDSAHTVHPVSGQGMALAITDADTLGSIISKLLSSESDPQEVFNIKSCLEISEKYTNLRRPIVCERQKEVIRLGSLLVSENPVVDLMRIFLIDMIDASSLFERYIEGMLQSEVDKF
jgi:2-polyprenyl-6-methoxyphenol hydroxylase-like FAD-dependent oxidoreductase